MKRIRYNVTVDESRNSTYLSDGTYDAEVGKQETYFRNVRTGGGTSVNNRMIAIFVKQGRLRLEVAA